MSIVVISGPAISITVLAQWTVPPIALPAGGTFDLKTTLPANMPTGGVFAIASGTLPVGVTLALAGILTVAAGTAGASSPGITFSYTLP